MGEGVTVLLVIALVVGIVLACIHGNKEFDKDCRLACYPDTHKVVSRYKSGSDLLLS